VGAIAHHCHPVTARLSFARGSFVFCLVDFYDLYWQPYFASFRGTIRAYLDVQNIGNNSKLGFFIVPTSLAFHFIPPS
jgi:hypothetical protein